MPLLVICYVILGKLLYLSKPQFQHLSSFEKCLTQHLEGAKKMMGVNYYTILLVGDSKNQAGDIGKAIVQRRN